LNQLNRALGAAALALLCALTSGCISVEYGTPLITAGLASLELEKSTHADILLALGQPRGKGSLHVSQSPDPRDMLFYEYIKSDGKNTELEILTVLMLDQHYDGYLWFASSERMRKQGNFPVLERPQQVKIVQGYFPETAPLEDRFVRGSTSRDEILNVLGAPGGIGAAILPPEHKTQDALFYEDLEAGDMKYVDGVIVMDTRQRILVVLLTDDVYDGFLWYSNVGLAEAKSQ
jgi:outer membrane protein assembly factor BamE (lipoprotein component of BamABCDE complex)